MGGVSVDVGSLTKEDDKLREIEWIALSPNGFLKMARLRLIDVHKLSLEPEILDRSREYQVS